MCSICTNCMSNTLLCLFYSTCHISIYFHLFPNIATIFLKCDRHYSTYICILYINTYINYIIIFINIFSVHFLRFPIHGYTHWYIHSYRKKVVDNVYSKCPIIFYPRSRFSNTYSIPIHEQQQVSTFIPIKTPKLMVDNYVCSRSKLPFIGYTESIFKHTHIISDWLRMSYYLHKLKYHSPN